jgi:TldD protein
MIYEGIGRHARLFGEYTELRVQENRSVKISLINGDVVGNARASEAGVSARSYKAGVWGFASSPEYDDPAIARVVDTATLNARFLASREGRAGESLPRTSSRGARDLGPKGSRATQKDMLDYARAVDDYVAKAQAGLMSRSVIVSCLDMEKVLLTSDGAEASSLVPRAHIYVLLSKEAKEGGSVEIMDVIGGLGGFEELFPDPERMRRAVDESCEHLARKAEGVYAQPGEKDVVLSPDLVGILAHEAVGHVVEGDLVLGGSVAADYMGKRVASDLVTLVDFAHHAMGKTCLVPVWTDDEGTEALDAVLIDRGILRSYMHSKETAARLGAQPTGNGRAFAFSDEPLVRMRNTGILPGTSKLEEMIASIDDGYYLVRTGNGQADSTSEFMFGINLGYEIKGGKLGRAIKDTTVSGVAFEMLKTVSMVGDEVEWHNSGFCGKKQMIPVSAGGPAVKCRINVGGR